MNPILAKDYIQDLQTLLDYECRVCFDFDLPMMRCKGPCKGALCLGCATSISRTSYQNRCPQRCSSPLKLQYIAHLQPPFKYPYDAEKCSNKIQGYQAFMGHISKCEYITQEAAKDELKKKEFLCQKSHPLLFLDNMASCHIFNEVSVKSFTHQCAKCFQRKICRAYCSQCSQQNKIEAYCNGCRPLPCTKKLCPKGHQFVQQSLTKANLNCSLCGFCIYFYSDKYFSDQKCDFSVCQLCLLRFSDNHHLIPLKINLSSVKKYWNYFNKSFEQKKYLNYLNRGERKHKERLGQKEYKKRMRMKLNRKNMWRKNKRSVRSRKTKIN